MILQSQQVLLIIARIVKKDNYNAMIIIKLLKQAIKLVCGTKLLSNYKCYNSPKRSFYIKTKYLVSIRYI